MGDLPLGGENRAVMRNSERYSCFIRERSGRLDKAPKQGQVFRVRYDLRSRFDARHLDVSDERQA